MSPAHRHAIAAVVGTTASWALSYPLTKALLQEQSQLVPGGGTWFFSAWILAARCR